MKDNFKYTKEMIEWRRNTVLSKLAKGYSQADIAKELQLHPSTISLDVQYLKEKAREELRTHLTEKLPWEYARAVNGINDLLKRAHDILDRTTDPKMQLQTISVLTGLYGTVMSLATDGGIIQQSLKRLEVMQDKNEAIFSDKEVKEYYQQEGESASNKDEPTEQEEQQQLEEHFGGKGISADSDSNDEEPEPTEQDEDLKEE